MVKFGNIATLLSSALNKLDLGKVFILVDENTREHCLPIIQKELPENHTVTQISSGEENKNLDTCSKIWEALTDNNAERNSVLINLGGGVIGDMGGFCASTYKRGIPFVNIPTTLLAQVDASVGGKLGIDFNHLKNHIGLFRNPDFVLIDSTFLKTLPLRQIRSGFAEIVKHSLIKDLTHWQLVKEKGFEYVDWKEIIPLNIEIKNSIVKSDFRETGMRKILNFGHTMGHAIETFLLKNGGDILHGEAIAAGMIMESYLSEKLSGLSTIQRVEIETKLLEWYGKIAIKTSDYSKIVDLMKQDKKNQNGEILSTLLVEIGKGIIDQPLKEGDITDSLEHYQNL